MDSSDSGSMQSSSGEEDEQKQELKLSRPKIVPMEKQSQPLKVNHLHLSSSSSNSLDPLSCHMYPSSSGPIGQQNQATTHLSLENNWSKRRRSDLGATAVGELQQFLSPNLSQISSSSTSTPHHSLQAPMPETSSTGRTTGSSSNNMVGARTPKKRSRASRRVPTTVLTTNTNNFRAMVQEFTGIPIAPLASPPVPRVGRLDIYGASSSSRTLLDGSPLLTPNSLPPYLLKPFPHKIQQPPSLLSQLAQASPSLGLSTSHVDATTITTQLCNPAISHSSSSSSIDLLAKINLQRNPFFQSFNSPLNSNLKMGMGDFGLTHGHVGSSLMQLQSSLLPSSSHETIGLGTSNLSIPTDDQFIRSVSGNFNNSQSAVDFSGNDLSGFGFHDNKGPPGHSGLHS